jgi:epoxyqueuosine reductase QueG
MGVSAIGYTKLPQPWIFQDKAVLYDNAIVLTMEMDKQKMDTAPSPASHLAAVEIYHYLGDAVIAIARFLRAHGYAAHAGHPLMGLALYPPLAQRAGLGWRGRHGMLITPQFGPRVRLAAVFTNIENLPFFTEENPHRWIPTYCQSCGLCIKQCPAGAIYEQPIPRENGLVTCVDVDQCFPQFAEHYGCSVCIRVCPFNRGLYETLKR